MKNCYSLILPFFNMKILSIILTSLLLIPVVVCSMAVFQIFHQFNSELIPKDSTFSIAEPSILYGVSYLVFFGLAILLNIKGKFRINVVLSGCLVLIYFVTINLIKVHG
jgi:hypothetical protein